MKNKASFFISRFSFVGIGYYILFQNSSINAWISIILGTLLGIGIIYLISLFKNKDIKYNEEYIIYKIIYILFNLYIVLIILTTIPLFVNSFYLTTTPPLVVLLPFLLTAMYIAYKSKSVLVNLSNILYVFSIILIIITLIALFKYIELENYLPILNNGYINIIKSSLIYASITSIPYLLTIDYKSTFKYDLKSYLISSLTILLASIYIIGSLGPIMIHLYSFPEYTVLKKISLLGFIQNVENILSFIYYFDLMITLSLALYNIKNNITNKYIYYIFISIIFLISIYVFNSNYTLILMLFYSYPYILYIFLIIILILLKLCNKKTRRIKSI